MGIRDAFWPWVPQRVQAGPDGELSAEYVAWFSSVRALDGEQVGKDLGEQEQWMRDVLQELGATDDVFNVLADMQQRAIVFGVLLGDLHPR